MIKHFPFAFSAFLFFSQCCFAQSFEIENDLQHKTVTMSHDHLKLVLNYDHQCHLTYFGVNGQNVIDENAGMYSEIKTGGQTFSTIKLEKSPFVKVTGKVVEVSDIIYGDGNTKMNERWQFALTDTGIQFTIKRNCPKSFEAESVSFPAIRFNDINTWEGAFQSFGGIAWFYLFIE